MLMVALVHSRLDYGNTELAGILAYPVHRLRLVLCTAARLIYNLKRFDHISNALINLRWLLNYLYL